MVGRALDMDIPLEQVQRDISGVFRRKVELRELEKERLAPVVAPPCGQQNESKDACVSKKAENGPQTAPAHTRAMSIVIEYDVAKEPQIKTCLENLKKLCVNFGVRYRQE
jgi:hypothetical protein